MPRSRWSLACDLRDRLAEFLELHLQRIEQAAELLLALLAKAFGLVVEDRVGEILERFAQTLLGLVEQREFFGADCSLLARGRFERRMEARQFLEPLLQAVARTARVGQLVREPCAVRLVRRRLRGQRAQVFLGLRPFLLEAFDAAREIGSASERRVALLGEHGDFAVANRARPASRACAIQRRASRTTENAPTSKAGCGGDDRKTMGDRFGTREPQSVEDSIVTAWRLSCRDGCVRAKPATRGTNENAARDHRAAFDAIEHHAFLAA